MKKFMVPFLLMLSVLYSLNSAHATSLWGTTYDQIFQVDTATGQVNIVKTYSTVVHFTAITQTSNGHLYVSGEDSQDAYLAKVDPNTGIFLNKWYIEDYGGTGGADQIGSMEVYDNNRIVGGILTDWPGIYDIQLDSNGNLSTLSTTGAISGNFGSEPAISGIAKNPINGTWYATIEDTEKISKGSQLYTFDPNNPSNSIPGPAIWGDKNPMAFTFDGTLWESIIGGSTWPDSSLFALNPITGEETFMFNLSTSINGRITGLSRSAQPVPEPSTLILFGTGFMGLFGWGRKKLKKN